MASGKNNEEIYWKHPRAPVASGELMIGPGQNNNGTAVLKLPAGKSPLVVPWLGAVIDASIVPWLDVGGRLALQSNKPMERTPTRYALRAPAPLIGALGRTSNVTATPMAPDAGESPLCRSR